MGGDGWRWVLAIFAMDINAENFRGKTSDADMIGAIISPNPCPTGDPCQGIPLNNIQIGFDFLPELPQAPHAATKPAAKPAARKKAGTAPMAMDPEACARVLEDHPDFRVQRRLHPTLLWPLQAGGATRRVIVLDTETTGLEQTKERIMELALLVVDVDVYTGLPVGPVQVYDGLEDPGKPIPKEVVAITGLTDADVAGQRLDESRIAELLRGADVVVAHNAAFDRPFVEARLGGFSGIPWACSFADIDWKSLGHGSAKLESLAQAHGWFYDAHRAEMDCHALLAVLAKPLSEGNSAGTGLARLLEAAQGPAYKLQATQAPFDAKDKLKARGYRWNADDRVWHTRLQSAAALEAECEWLKVHIYAPRAAFVHVEIQDALVKYSTRKGSVSERLL
jgi:DNA polymerase-3 subunit epsilon